MMTLFVPFWICAVAGGFLFGFLHGAFYTVIGGTLGATGVYLLSRSGFSAFTSIESVYLGRIESGFRSHGILYLIVLRLIPLFPFTAVNIAPAILGLPLRLFVAGTLLGMIPITLIYTKIGAGLRYLSADGGQNCALKADMYLPLFGLALLILFPIIYKGLKSSIAIRRAVK
jgi:uncharacterized membrane protein YdjX (TVP38/TMEM64 family)